MSATHPITALKPLAPYLEAQAVDQELFLEIVTLLYQSRRTAALSLVTQDGVSVLYFEQGAVQYAQSPVHHHRLGEILKQQGTIDEHQLQQALNVPSPMRLGEALVELNYVSTEQLWQALKHQALLVIQAATLGEVISFRLSKYTTKLLPLSLQINAQGLLLEVLRQKDEVNLALQSFPSLQDYVYLIEKQVKPVWQDLSFDLQQALRDCHGQYTLPELIFKHTLGALPAIKLYRTLWKRGLIQFSVAPLQVLETPMPEKDMSLLLPNAYHRIVDIDEMAAHTSKKASPFSDTAPHYSINEEQTPLSDPSQTSSPQISSPQTNSPHINLPHASSPDLISSQVIPPQTSSPQVTPSPTRSSSLQPSTDSSSEHPLWFQQIDTPPLVSLCQNLTPKTKA